MGLKELRAVLAVADFGSFRRAASELGYTQSALSHQVSSLEATLGLRLFHRPGGRGQVRLTAAGEAVCRRARRVLTEVEAIPADAEQAGLGERVPLRVGVSQTMAAEIMPPALQAFGQQHPGTEVVLEEVDDFESTFEALARGRLDLAFAHNPELDDRVDAVPVLEDSWVVLTRRDSSIAEVDRLSLDVLDGLEVVAWTRRWRVQLELEEALRRRGIAPRIVYRTDDNLALQRLVAAGLGHAFIGQFAARRAIDPALTFVQLRELLSPRQIALVYPRRREMSATARSMVTEIRAQTIL
jgi:DNA-binding transcriptional LysR family regulator